MSCYCCWNSIGLISKEVCLRECVCVHVLACVPECRNWGVCVCFHINHRGNLPQRYPKTDASMT